MTHPLTRITRDTPSLAARLLQSYATLDRHKQAGAFERNAALRLLENNARDAARHSGTHWSTYERRTAAACMLDSWLARG